MANEEQVSILRQSVDAWNDWRDANPNVRADLRGADLEGANLRDANLRDTNLRNANLRNADLYGTILTGAILSHVTLTGDIHNFGLLSFFNLDSDIYRGVILDKAILDKAVLIGADLYKANLRDANLFSANLRDAVLIGADLSAANLRDTNLYKVNLRNANLYDANLSRVQALGTNFENATLTGACIEDWNINADTNLNDIICDYVYLKYDWKTGEFQERRPHTGTFAPGEFAKLVQQSLNTIDLIFREGLNWKAFAYSFKQTESQHQDAHLSIRDIGNRDDGVVIVKVATTPDADKALIHSEFMKGYEFASKEIAAQYEARLVDKDQHINQLVRIVGTLQEVQKLMAEQRSGDNYYGDIKAINFSPHGTATGGVYNDFSNTQNLAHAAAQIQALLAQLQQQGHSSEDAQQQVANDLAEQAKQDPTTLGKLVMWGQKLGDATITDVVKGVVKMALRSAGVPLP